MPERIDARPAVAFVGGALLLVSLFITWYETPAQLPAIAAAPVGNAWDIFESLDLILAGIGAAAIYAGWEQLTGRFRFGEGSWLLPLSLAALVIVASQILDPPRAAGVGSDPVTGAWLALGGAGALVIAGVLSVANLSLAVELDSTSSRPSGTRRRAVQGDA